MTSAPMVIGSNGFSAKLKPRRPIKEHGFKLDWSEILAFLDTIQIGDVYEITLPEETTVDTFRVVVSRFGSKTKRKFSVLTTKNEDGDEVIEITRRR